MDAAFHKIDLETWERREEYESFSRSGCGFTMTAELDITHLRRFAKENGAKLYPMLVAVAAQAVNAHREFCYGWGGEDEFGYYETMHPLFFDVMESGNMKCLVAEYKPDALQQAAEIERVRAVRGRGQILPAGGVPAQFGKHLRRAVGQDHEHLLLPATLRDVLSADPHLRQAGGTGREKRHPAFGLLQPCGERRLPLRVAFSGVPAAGGRVGLTRPRRRRKRHAGILVKTVEPLLRIPGKEIEKRHASWYDRHAWEHTS